MLKSMEVRQDSFQSETTEQHTQTTFDQLILSAQAAETTNEFTFLYDTLI